MDVQVGSTITNGTHALRVTARAREESSWFGIVIPMSPNDPVGETLQVQNGELGGWSHVPFEWWPVTGEDQKERYTWSGDYRWLRREVRPWFPRLDTSQS